ncbi:MAG: hypothetical protein KIG14_02190, partial [Candidatus Sacchiramonaceae bacterium]|nr:hypothetical protein [Candidatus Saccharimonadaceae bacterium]
MDDAIDKSQFQIPNFSAKKPAETPIREMTNQAAFSTKKTKTTEASNDFSQLIKKGWQVIEARQKAAKFLEKSTPKNARIVWLKAKRSANFNPYFYKNQALKLGPFKKLTIRDLVNSESQLGSTIFGALAENQERKFFNLDEDTWIWYEARIDNNGQKYENTIRYEVQPDKIIKVQAGPRYSALESGELHNFEQAIVTYNK